MPNKISNEDLINKLWLRTSELMKDAFDRIENNEYGIEKILYTKKVHKYLKDERLMPHIYKPREIMLPLVYKEWPDRFKDLTKTYNEHMLWPKYNTQLYVADKLMPPKLPDPIYCGYALYGEQLVPCTFFVHMEMTEQTCGDTKELLPECFVIDPIAYRDGKNPKCYIGILISLESMEEWFLSKRKTKQLIEIEVDCLDNRLLEEIRDDKEWDNEIGKALQATLNGITNLEKREEATKWIGWV